MKQKLLASLILMSSIVWISATDATTIREKEESRISFIDQTEQVEKVMPQLVLAADTIPKKITKSKSAVIEIENGEIKRMKIDGVEIPEDEFDKHSIFEDDLNDQRYLFFDSIKFENFQGLEHLGHLEHLEHLDHLDHFEFFHPDSMGDRFLFDFSNGWEGIDSVWSFQDFDNEDFRFDFHNMDTLIYGLDTMRFHNRGFHFNSDSLRFRMQDLKDEIGELGQDLHIFFDTFDFNSIGSDLKFYFDSLEFGNIGRGFQFLDTFDFGRLGEHDFYFDHGSNLEGAFIRELKRDGLHKEGLNDIILSDQSLSINGVEQSEEMLQKYKRIYERKTGLELGEGSTLKMQVTDSRGGRMKRL